MATKSKTKLIRHEPATAYALIVGCGPRAYVSAEVFTYVGAKDGAKTKAEMQISQPYHKAVPAVVLTLADYRRLLKAADQRS